VITLRLVALVLLGIPAAAFVAESADLLAMRATAPASIVSVQVDSGGEVHKRGRSGTRPAIRYRFEAEGRVVESARDFPGWLANAGRWTGGALAAKRFAPGDVATIHYVPGDPERACLEHGWSPRAAFIAPLVRGIGRVGFARSRYCRRRLLLEPMGIALLGYGLVGGLATMTLLGGVVRVRESHWHVLAIAALYAAGLVWHFSRARSAIA
jgi:hypothetical protein